MITLPLFDVLRWPFRHKTLLALLAAFGAVAAYGDVVSERHGATLGVVLVAFAPFALGGLTGFLFGIPRTITNGAPTLAFSYQPNTNLEQVSDWLTKLLLGIGLTQLNRLPEIVQDTGEYLAAGIGPGCSAGVMGAIVVGFAIAGFVVSYISTRIYFTRAVRDAEQPNPDSVGRLADQALPVAPNSPTPLNTDMKEVLRFSIDDLQTPEQLLAWGRAKLQQNPRSPDVVRAFDRALERAPDDLRAAENATFASLYVAAPTGFKSAIQYAQNYLTRPDHKPGVSDANLYAFLACAYGQAHRYAVKNHDPDDTVAKYRAEVISNARKAIDLAPSWKPTLRGLANPKPGDDDNDLMSLREDTELKALLA